LWNGETFVFALDINFQCIFDLYLVY